MIVQGSTELIDSHMEPHWLLMTANPDRLEKLPGPRVLTTHRHFQDLPQDFIKHRRKIVCVLRDPKDVCVSFFNMLRALKAVHYEGSFDGFLSLFLEGKVPFNSWTDWILSYEQGLRDHPELAVHTVHYEQLKLNPVMEIKRLAEYLQVNIPLSFAENVATKTSFSSMKQFKERIPNPVFRTYRDNKDVIYRSGEKGLWRRWFTEQQAKEFDAYVRKRLGRPEVKPKL